MNTAGKRGKRKRGRGARPSTRPRFSVPVRFQCVLLVCSCFSGPRKPVRGRYCTWWHHTVLITFSSSVSLPPITAFSAFTSETRPWGRSWWLLRKHPQSQCSLTADPGGGRVQLSVFRVRCVFPQESCHYSRGRHCWFLEIP